MSRYAFRTALDELLAKRIDLERARINHDDQRDADTRRVWNVAERLYDAAYEEFYATYNPRR